MKQIRYGIYSIILLLWLGCSMQAARAALNSPASVVLIPHHDSWSASKPRWRDINNNVYSAFENNTQQFNYANQYDPTTGQVTQVTITYDRAPSGPYFSGHLDAVGLKPNFCYQIKLLGKPVYGIRGFGTNQSYLTVSSEQPAGTAISHPVLDSTGTPTRVNADDWANQQIGYAGRWWDDEPNPPSTNISDSYYTTYYPGRTVYGYILMADFVTDENGNASLDFQGNHSYHVTWASWNTGGNKQVAFWGPTALSSVSGYGYGSVLDPTTQTPVTLYYEYESGRPQPVTLNAGTYHCRMVLTEESFHNDYGQTAYTDGGEWDTALCSEDFSYDSNGNQIGPDTNPANDVVFTIPPSNLTASGGNNSVTLSWNTSTGLNTYNVLRSTSSGSGYVQVASGLTGSSYKDNSVTNNIPYYYVVQAVGTGGASSYSNQASATPSTIPAAPSGLKATATSRSRINLSWADNSNNETGFKVERSPNGVSSWTQIAQVGANVTSYANTGLSRSTTYYYRVRAYNSLGNSGYSNITSATTPHN